MKKIIASILCACFAAPAFSAQFEIGRSVQRHNFDVALTIRNFQVEYIDEGAQSNGIPNRNRVLNLDYIISRNAGFVSLFVKGGITTSRFSTYGGSGPHTINKTWFTGQNVAVGFIVPFNSHWGFVAQSELLRYRQCDIPAFENYGYTSAMFYYNF